MKRPMILVGAGVAVVLFILSLILTVEYTTVEGNQLGVKETWGAGVDPNPLSPKTYFFYLYGAWSTTVYKYDLSPNIFVMNDRKDDERANGRSDDSYVAQSSDNQKMTLWLALQWRYDPAKIVDIHKMFHTHLGRADWQEQVEERMIRPALIAAVNTEATKLKAIDAYSGEGFVRLQSAIITRLSDPASDLRGLGIITENFVIEKIKLDDEYIGEINKRQVAQQRELRAKQEELAALAEAQRAKAEAQSNYEKMVVEAERDKQVQILASEAEAKQRVNAATAAAEQVRLAAIAESDANKARASGILALGQAEAEATKLKLMAYAVEGSDAFVRIKVAEQMSLAFQNIKGYLPSDMNITMLSDNFTAALDKIVGGPKP